MLRAETLESDLRRSFNDAFGVGVVKLGLDREKNSCVLEVGDRVGAQMQQRLALIYQQILVDRGIREYPGLEIREVAAEKPVMARLVAA